MVKVHNVDKIFFRLLNIWIFSIVRLLKISQKNPNFLVCAFRKKKTDDSSGFFKTTEQVYIFSSLFFPFFLFQISWIFVINQVPCVSSCWGQKTHTAVDCNESREPHTSHFPSRPVTKKITNRYI